MKNQFDVIWSPESLKQIRKIKKGKSKDKSEKYFIRIAELSEDIKDSPFQGIGKPEHLRYKLPPCWSRRINLKDRLIYRIKKNQIQIVSILGHYDK